MQHVAFSAPPIAVIGMAARFAGADDVEQYWANLVNCVESVIPQPEAEPCDSAAPNSGDNGRFVRAVGKVNGIEWFDADYFRVPSAEAVITDPQQRVLLEVAAEALEDAGYAGERDAVVGVFAGCGENHYLREHIAPAEARSGQLSDVRITLGNEKDFLASRLAFKLGLTGPAVTVQTACATGLSAIALACTSLAAGDCDIALAGGVSLIMPDIEGYTYTEGGMRSADGRCRPFDAQAAGAVPGSGAGIVVLRRDTDAQTHRDCRRAVIRGWAINNDGGSRAGFTVPNVDGQEAVIRAALARAGIKPSQVGYIEAHGTGTAIGDPIEFEALRRVFATAGRQSATCTLGAVKPNIGHTDAAAGVAGLIKATLAAERAILPGTLHFRSPNSEIDLTSTPFVITAETRPWDAEGPRIAGISSFGLGGSNAHVVLESVQAETTSPAARPRQVIVLSARSDQELNQLAKRLADRLETMSPLDDGRLADIAYTLSVGRPRFARRWAAVITDAAEAIAQLRGTVESGRSIARWSLSIHGTPHELAEMGARLLATEPLLRPALAELAGGAEWDGLAPARAGALAAAALTRILIRLGLSFSRIDAPRWAHPVARWLTDGADSASLAAALDACTDDTDAGSTRGGVGRILVGPSFDLASAVATAWREGVVINWPAYYGDEPRRRVPLPTYPFTRRRFWLDRPETRPDTAAPHTSVTARADGMSVIDYVGSVWCDVFGAEHIAYDAHFLNDLDGDSLYAVEIGARLNQGLGLDLPLDLPFIAPTIATTAAFIENSLAPEAS